MKKILLSLVVLNIICVTHSIAQVTPKEKGLEAITIDAIKGQLEFVAVGAHMDHLYMNNGEIK